MKYLTKTHIKKANISFKKELNDTERDYTKLYSDIKANELMFELLKERKIELQKNIEYTDFLIENPEIKVKNILRIEPTKYTFNDTELYTETQKYTFDELQEESELKTIAEVKEVIEESDKSEYIKWLETNKKPNMDDFNIDFNTI